MAKRTNYSFEKRQKEAKRKKKQLEKLEKKRLSKAAASGTLPADGIAPVDGEAVPADQTPKTSDG